MKKALIIALLLLLIPVTALAAVYVYKAIFSCQVTVEPGMPGLEVSPAVLQFGSMAQGDWSRQEMLTIKNIGSETIVSLFFEKTGPADLDFYPMIAPIMPLEPGTAITFPVSLKTSETFPSGSYTFDVKVVGQR